MGETYGDRIKKLRETRGISIREAAKLSEGLFSHGYLAQLEAGISSWQKVSLQILQGMARAFNMSLSDFVDYVNGVNEEFVMTPFRNAPILGVAEAGQPFEYPVPIELYRPNMVVYQVSGSSLDSGSPDAIKDGDYLFIDTNDQELRNGKLYVFEIIGDGHCVKRARLVNDEWLLMSDNPEYPTLKITEVKIVGKVYKAFGQRIL